MSEILLVMVHLFEEMPESEEFKSNIKWKEYSDRLIDKTRDIDWPIIYQLDFLNKECYNKLTNALTRYTEKSFGMKWSFFKQFGQRLPNTNLRLRENDYLSTSNEETDMIIKYCDPKIVLFGGLHKDRCVINTKEAVFTTDREYHVSEKLSYSWRQTWQDN